LEFLSPDEIGQIHKASLSILEDVGVLAPSETILEILSARGAAVDFDSQVVRFPRRLVKEVIEKTPKSFEVTPAYFENRFKVGDGVLKLWMNYTQDICEWKTGERRLCSQEDMMKGILLGNALPFVGNNNVIGTPEGVPPEIVDLYCWYVLYQYSTKACNSWIYNLRSARHILDLAIAAAGSEDNLRTKKNLMYYAESISPLKWGRHTLDIMQLYSKYEVPIFLGPMVSAGGSGPVTLAGALALANAEILSGTIIINCLNPNQPIIYPSLITPLNMRTAMISYGAPEVALLAAASAQIAGHYGLPCSGNVHLSDSNQPDFQYGYEKAATFALALAAGMEMWGIVGYHAAGHMGTNPGVSSLEGLVLDDECFGYMARILRGIEVNEETLALDAIREVGIGGNFLDHGHTFNHFKKELWDPGLFVRESYSNWLAGGKKSAIDNTYGRMEEIIRTRWPCEPAVVPETRRELEKVFNGAKHDLLGGR
jgi:trimethylamine--corrinoid protein Co-methyltransferase